MIRVGVQFFNKPDTVIATLDSLGRCAGAERVHLTLLQDGIEGHRPLFAAYAPQHRAARQAVEEWRARHGAAFASIEIVPQPVGRGTAATARILCDRLAEGSSWFVFSEDDVVYASDALEWFAGVIEDPAIFTAEVWGVAGESKFFDAGNEAAPEDLRRRAVAVAAQDGLKSAYLLNPVMPSSCFATTPGRWRIFGATRGEPQGPRKVCERLVAEEARVVWPVVARCSDIGMHHPAGFSMTLKKSAERVPGKNLYLLSDQVEGAAGPLRRARGTEIARLQDFRPQRAG